jgi:hypothetical protein
MLAQIYSKQRFLIPYQRRALHKQEEAAAMQG